MADCCAEIRSELAALRAEISKINKKDLEPRIKRLEDNFQFFERLKPLIPYVEILIRLPQKVATVTAMAQAAEIAANFAKNAVEKITKTLGRLTIIIEELTPLRALSPYITALIAGVGLAEIVTRLQQQVATAKSVAEAAKTVADSSKKIADSAKTIADTSRSVADTAKTVAETAKGGVAALSPLSR